MIRQQRRNHPQLSLSSFQTQSRRTVISVDNWGKGQDLLGDSLEWGDKPKIILDGYSSSGFNVINLIEKIGMEKRNNGKGLDIHSPIMMKENVKEQEEKEGTTAASGAVHMIGSVIAFPYGCFLWNVTTIHDVTLESLTPILLHRPKLEYLFLGSDEAMDQQALHRIRQPLREKGIIMEQMDISNAMGTFNILNGEDRPVAAALVVGKEKEHQ